MHEINIKIIGSLLLNYGWFTIKHNYALATWEYLMLNRRF